MGMKEALGGQEFWDALAVTPIDPEEDLLKLFWWLAILDYVDIGFVNRRTRMTSPSGLAARRYIEFVLIMNDSHLCPSGSREILLRRCVIPTNSVVVQRHDDPGEMQTWRW